MAKQQKCGTCRFFQEAGLAGSGWCHHPDRKTSSDVMIMVRRSELACRDDWSRSLWQPATGAHDEAEPLFSRSPLTGPMPPTSPRELSNLLDQEIVSSGVAGEDVLLSEARIISEPTEAKTRWETPPRAIQMPNFDPRTAIFRAREAYRDKVKAKATEARMMSAAEPIAEPLREHLATTSERHERILDHAPLDHAPSETKAPEARPVEETRTLVTPAVSTMAPVAAAATARSSPVEKSLSQRRAPENGTVPRASKRVELPVIEAAIETAVPDRAPPAAILSDDADVHVEAPPTSGLPEWYRTDLPRVCRTCRDYRPSADGLRGWCANGWAFTHRRLVQSDDSAPCHSAIGDWWAPVDDVWLVAADVSSHGRATPHLDRITGQETARRRRS